MPGETTADRVHILMGLHNGAPNLAEQLQSFAAQSHAAWDLTVSDDGSADDGPRIVREFAARMAPAGHRIELVAGPQAGFAANFLSLIAAVPKPAGWLALSDQDDVWLPHRLARGLAALRALPAEQPALYCSRTWITDPVLGQRRLSARFARPPGFRNALVQNIVAGNTILLNPAAGALARRAAPGAAAVPGLVAHDWWIYQLITGVGGSVIHDPEPTLLYRQHGQNLIGANDGWRARKRRIRQLLSGVFADWNTANIGALMAAGVQLTDENRALLDTFAARRREPLWGRLRLLTSLRLYRQGRLGQAALWLAVLMGRV